MHSYSKPSREERREEMDCKRRLRPSLKRRVLLMKSSDKNSVQSRIRNRPKLKSSKLRFKMKLKLAQRKRKRDLRLKRIRGFLLFRKSLKNSMRKTMGAWANLPSVMN
jgi:hypothetical protein